jgi:aspartate dehydrogenase
MRIALIGGGTIARLVLEHVRGGRLGKFEVVALLGRVGGAPRGRELAREFGVRYDEDRAALIAAQPQTVIEAAGHEAVRQHLVPLLEARIGVVVLSAGALIDDALRGTAEAAANRSGTLLYVPSGGIRPPGRASRMSKNRASTSPASLRRTCSSRARPAKGCRTSRRM